MLLFFELYRFYKNNEGITQFQIKLGIGLRVRQHLEEMTKTLYKNVEHLHMYRFYQGRRAVANAFFLSEDMLNKFENVKNQIETKTKNQQDDET